jgi:beta-phosphoglucomutase
MVTWYAMIRGVIFDLDGVLVKTDELHYASWKQVTEAEGIPFDRSVNERLRGISRLDSVRIILERARRQYSEAEQAALAERKQAIFRSLLERLTAADLLPGAVELVVALRARGIRTAVGSSSKNTSFILDKLGLRCYFDVVVDGNDIVRSKPDPEVFLLAAARLGLAPQECVVVEDAVAGVEAARRAGMAVFGIGSPETLPGVTPVAPDLAHVTVSDLLRAGQ